jgi:hypothetical protein
MMELKILALIIMASGAFVNYGAGMLVNRYNFAEKIIVKIQWNFQTRKLKSIGLQKQLPELRCLAYL